MSRFFHPDPQTALAFEPGVIPSSPLILLTMFRILFPHESAPPSDIPLVAFTSPRLCHTNHSNTFFGDCQSLGIPMLTFIFQFACLSAPGGGSCFQGMIHFSLPRPEHDPQIILCHASRASPILLSTLTPFGNSSTPANFIQISPLLFLLPVCRVRFPFFPVSSASRRLSLNRIPPPQILNILHSLHQLCCPSDRSLLRADSPD